MRHILYVSMVALTLASCQTKPANTGETAGTDATQVNKQERNKQVIRSLVENTNKHSVDSALKDRDASFIDYSDGSMPPMKGDSATGVLKAYLTAFPDMKNENVIYCADGDYVMVYSDVTGTWTGELMGMKPTGRSMKIKDVDVFKLNDAGKIIEHHNVQNVGCVMASLGAQMPPEEKKK